MSSVLFHIENNVAVLTLNRPEKLNAFNREMALLLQAKLDECISLHEVRAVYLTGAGKGFSAGQDLEEITRPGGAGLETILTEHYNPLVTRIRNLPKPVIAAVNGVAAGAGANIAFCCDIILATRSASFLQAFSKIGLIPDSGGTFTLPRLVGWQRASALMMLGQKLSADEAREMGIVYKVYDDILFAEESLLLAKGLAQGATRGLALTKHALNYSLTNSLESQLLLENDLQQKAASTQDFKEGVKAFLEKKQPVFKGE
jgi:2-(1,2-epoxy-1,2-dihydrophenyl)acetyl-CoA isomerase